MEKMSVIRLLESVRDGEVDVESALEKLSAFPFETLPFAVLDHHRSLRSGFPEVVLCQGKTDEQAIEIITRITRLNRNLLATRAEPELFEKLKEISPELEYNREGRIIYRQQDKTLQGCGTIAVITAGTSDIPVAEEAAVTATVMGNRVERIYDVGVAGIHRLFARFETLRAASVLVVAAGMEGALPSVVGGIVDRPVVAVPTSTGYGASFKGIAALLGMLNSCAAGTVVVNIDNGFGAGYAAALINRKNEKGE